MAKAKTGPLVGGVASAAMAGLVAISPAFAQEARTVAMPAETVGTILCETDRTYYAHNNWTPETADLDCADEAATEYATTTPGVGVLIHVGQDIPNDHVANPSQLGEALVGLFKNKYGVDAKFFLRQNDALATGITYHIGEDVHGANDGTQVKGLRDAINAMPEVSGILKLEWADQLAARADEKPIISPGG